MYDVKVMENAPNPTSQKSMYFNFIFDINNLDDDGSCVEHVDHMRDKGDDSSYTTDEGSVQSQ